MILDFTGGTILLAVLIFNVVAIIGVLEVSRAARLMLTASISVWVGLQFALAAAGVFAGELARQFPLVGIMVVLPLAATALAAAASPALRTALLALPLPLMIGLNISRVFGAYFLFLAASGRLGGPFPQSAGWGDVATGVLALPLAYLVARGAAMAAARWWNVFGAADLIVAVGLGTMSFNGFVLQMIEAGPGSDAVLQLPWSLIPTVLVPFYLILHGIMFVRLRASSLPAYARP